MIIAVRRWLTCKDWRMRALVSRMHHDQGGNIIVLYIAAALLLVGMLWAIIGTGARVVQKETIQSSADAAAFSAAVIKAKGLNIISFCNLVMALLLAIIMFLRLINDLLTILVGICLAACLDIYGGEVLCAFAPSVETIQQNFSNIVQQVQPRIIDAMKALAQAERAVNETFQLAALAEGMQVGMHDTYKKNMGHGTLITVTFPLPLGDDFKLLGVDDDWDHLCSQAGATFDRVTELSLNKIGLGSVAGILGGAIGGLMNGLRSVLCPDDTSAAAGSTTSMIDTTQNVRDCNHCANPSSGETVQGARWSNVQQVIRDDHGHITGYSPAGDCQTSGVSSAWCDASNNPITDCNGMEVRLDPSNMFCNVKTQQKANPGTPLSSSDKPVPLKMMDNWGQHTQVRAFTLLTDTAMSDRRQSVAVGSKNKGTAPFLNQMMGMAQAEFYHFNGPRTSPKDDDLWHMDWRARLVRFNVTDPNLGDTSGTPGADTIASKFEDFLFNDVGSALKDQFLVH